MQISWAYQVEGDFIATGYILSFIDLIDAVIFHYAGRTYKTPTLTALELEAT